VPSVVWLLTAKTLYKAALGPVWGSRARIKRASVFIAARTARMSPVQADLTRISDLEAPRRALAE
jgi:hypothetical protein